MSGPERGFTLVETMTAVLVLGVFVTFAVPLFRELNELHLQKQAQMETVNLMAEKMEQMAGTAGNQCVGSRRERSRFLTEQSYDLHWRCERVEPYLYRYDVEVNWHGRAGKAYHKHWITHRYVPEN